MTIYIILILLLILLSIFIPKKNDLLYVKITFIAISLVSALRANSVGTDLAMYCRAFANISELSVNAAADTTRYEFGFILFCKILSFLNKNPQIFIAISSIIVNFSIIRFIYKNSSNKRLSIILYVVLTLFFTYMNIVRQALAIAIILFFYEYLKKNDIKRYVLGVLIATLFHTSAIIALLPIFIRNKKYTSFKYFLIIVISILFAIVGRSVIIQVLGIFTKYSGYMNMSYFKPNYFGAVISAFIVFAITTSYYFNIIKKEDCKYENKLVFSNLVLCMIFAFLSIASNISSRMESYFYIFTLIAIPEILNRVKNKKISIMFNKYFVVVIGIMYCFLILWLRPEWDSAVPYLFFWQQ